jgi:hypothetical protein
MQANRLLLTAALAVACSGGVASPAWLQTPTHILTVRWVRVWGVPQFEVRDGLCVVYVADAQQELTVVERLMEGCIARGAGVVRAPGTVQLHWHRIPNTRQAIDERMGSLMGASYREAGGFYFHPDPKGPCHIVTRMQQDRAGHELKHCFDGHFHDAQGRWLNR